MQNTSHRVITACTWAVKNSITMVLGLWIGSTLIQNFGIPTTFNNEASFIPVPIIFQVGSVIALLSLIPLAFIRSRKTA